MPFPCVYILSPALSPMPPRGQITVAHLPNYRRGRVDGWSAMSPWCDADKREEHTGDTP